MVRRASVREKEYGWCIYLCLGDALCLTLAFIHSKIQWDFVVPFICINYIQINRMLFKIWIRRCTVTDRIMKRKGRVRKR
jgi:hypothetical protein